MNQSQRTLAVLCAFATLGGSLQMPALAQPQLESVAPASAPPGSLITLIGRGFGTIPGTVVISGRRLGALSWRDSQVTLRVPEDAASGWISLRTAGGQRAGLLEFAVNRALPVGQLAPYGLRFADTGLVGSAYLVETDGLGLYAVSGFETLVTYELRATQPHVERSRI